MEGGGWREPILSGVGRCLSLMTLSRGNRMNGTDDHWISSAAPYGTSPTVYQPGNHYDIVHLSRTTSTAPITLCAHASAMRTPEVVYDLVHAPFPFLSTAFHSRQSWQPQTPSTRY